MRSLLQAGSSQPSSRLPPNPAPTLRAGSSSGIGRYICRAFAEAGASRIAILGRRHAVLQSAKSEIESRNAGVVVTTHTVDIADLVAVQNAAAEIGGWDVLVSNAGYLSDIKHLVDSEPQDWWKAFEACSTQNSLYCADLRTV